MTSSTASLLNTWLRRACCCFTAFSLSAFANPEVGAGAATLRTLIENDALRVSAWTEPARDVIARQPVAIVIEIGTSTRFSAGIVIGRPKVDNAIVLPPENFGLNFARRENGVTWSIQQWRLNFYPRGPGVYLIPPIPVRVSVADGSGGQGKSVTGTTETPALTATATAPAATLGLDEWVATTSLRVEHTLQGLNEDATLRVGDSIVRRVTIHGKDVPGMLLPGLRNEAIEGLGIYADRPELVFERTRGAGEGIRRESVTYVVEEAGQYVLPEARFHWWDLQNGTLRTIKLPGQEFTATGAVGLKSMLSRVGRALEENLLVLTASILAFVSVICTSLNPLTRHFVVFMAHYVRNDCRYLFGEILSAERQAREYKQRQFNSIRSHDYLCAAPGFRRLVARMSRRLYAKAVVERKLSWAEVLLLYWHLYRMRTYEHALHDDPLQLN